MLLYSNFFLPFMIKISFIGILIGKLKSPQNLLLLTKKSKISEKKIKKIIRLSFIVKKIIRQIIYCLFWQKIKNLILRTKGVTCVEHKKAEKTSEGQGLRLTVVFQIILDTAKDMGKKVIS